MHYYNEFHAATVRWIEQLIAGGYAPKGKVDGRSILDVTAADLIGYRQAHFFAGILGWCEALRLVDWPEEVEIWTGSPPCQPFSRAGKKKAKNDDRHLAPAWLDLVTERRPTIIAGEQVEDAIACGWIDDLQIHLEREGYAVAFIVLPACSVGAPHARKRLFFCAYRLDISDADRQRLAAAARKFYRVAIADGHQHRGEKPGSYGEEKSAAGCNGANVHVTGESGGTNNAVLRSVAHGSGDGRQGRVQRRPRKEWQTVGRSAGCGSAANNVGYAAGERCEGQQAAGASRVTYPDPLAGFWSGADWTLCRDGKLRAVKPGIQPLADGIPGRVAALRGYGNAIVPQVAAEFLAAFMDTFNN